MFFEKSLLFFVSGILYALILLIRILKHRAVFKRELGFAGIYGSCVLWLSVYCFPFDTLGGSYRSGWSLIPFGNLSMLLKVDNAVARNMLASLIRYFVISLVLAVVVSFCVALFSQKTAPASVLPKAFFLMVILQGVGIWCMLYGHSLEHSFDTGVIAVDLIGVLIGLGVYQLWDKMRGRRETA